MTINVAIKCPEGIVMGADSLVSIPSETGGISTIIPYYSKLFKIENPSDPKRSYAAGAMLNGDGQIGHRTIEDIILEFGEEYPKVQQTDNYNLRQLTQDLAGKIQKIIDTEIKGNNPWLEVIIGGYSKGESSGGTRYGEIYSLVWEHKPVRFRNIYNQDTEFGTHYGGEPKTIDRFQYGIDDNMIFEMMNRREKLFNQARDYISKELRRKDIWKNKRRKNKRSVGRVNSDDVMTIPMPKPLKEFDIFNLISDYQIGATPGENVKNIKDGSVTRLRTLVKFLSLQAAVNYCTFLMSCAYAENAFTFVIPTVGSEMRIASVTRDEGFRFRKIWEIQTPSSPFR
jgi:hypothetical protein